MTPLAFATYIRLKTHTNSTTFPDDNILAFAAIRMDQIAARICDYDEDYFGAPQFADLVNNQREYPLPSDMLNHIKKVEAQLDSINWLNLTELDLSQYEFTTDEATIVSYFSNTQNNANYYIYRGSLWILSGSIANFSVGNQALKLWSYQWPAYITDLTLTTDISQDPTNTSAGFPRVAHQSLADGVIIDYKMSADKPMQLTDSENNWETNMEKNIQTLTSINKDRSVNATMPNNTGLYNNGFNL
jgi:hypothetical protein